MKNNYFHLFYFPFFNDFSIGAGAINFGLGNVWDHASRLEKMDVVFVGIADPLLKQVTQKKIGSP